MLENVKQVINTFKSTMLESESGKSMVDLIERVKKNTTAKNEELEKRASLRVRMSCPTAGSSISDEKNRRKKIKKNARIYLPGDRRDFPA